MNNPTGWDDLVRFHGKNGLADVPDSPQPFFFGASDGLFLHRRIMLGRGAVKQSHWPDNWDEFGSKKGQFLFEAPPVPGVLMAQVVDFFRRTYRRLHAEAAVLLTFNEETKEWGVYVPTQLVSHGGVNYVYDPQTIKRPRYVVGSIHSHCDFSPFHSGTDTGDASDFDGLHMTIGYIEKDDPGIVAMMAMNKTMMDFDSKDFPNIFDYSMIGTANTPEFTAPAWWDQYVGGHSDKPVGFHLYKKFEKPTVIKNETKAVTTWQPSWVNNKSAKNQNQKSAPYDWDELNGYEYGMRALPPVGNGYYKDENGVFRPRPLNESAEFNAKKAAERGLTWDEEGRLDLDKLGIKVTNVTKEEKALLDDLGWMDGLDEDIADALLDFNLLTDEDYEWACKHPNRASDPKEWREILLNKITDAATILRSMGQEVTVDYGQPSDLALELLPDDTHQLGVL